MDDEPHRLVIQGDEMFLAANDPIVAKPTHLVSAAPPTEAYLQNVVVEKVFVLRTSVPNLCLSP